MKSHLASPVPIEIGDQVNRFLLCALVSESAKQIKFSAQRAGESLPMPIIVRGVLRSYRRAAGDKHGPLRGSEPDLTGLNALNRQIFREEIARHARERVFNSQTRLEQAERLGDESRIKAEKDGLDRARELRDQIDKNDQVEV